KSRTQARAQARLPCLHCFRRLQFPCHRGNGLRDALACIRLWIPGLTARGRSHLFAPSCLSLTLPTIYYSRWFLSIENPASETAHILAFVPAPRYNGPP